ncbi:hypothetical protein ACWEQ0_15860 [Nocardia thailandica]
MQMHPIGIHARTTGLIRQCLTVTERLSAGLRHLDTAVDGLLAADPGATGTFDTYLDAARRWITAVEIGGGRVLADLDVFAERVEADLRSPATPPSAPAALASGIVLDQRHLDAATTLRGRLADHLTDLVALRDRSSGAGLAAVQGAARGAADGRLLRARMADTRALAEEYRDVAAGLLSVADRIRARGCRPGTVLA